MEQLANCELILDIELIELITGGNQKFQIHFITTDKKKYYLEFDHVWDLRYSIENGYIERFCRFRENLPEGIIENGIYIVENSNYTNYFEQQCCSTRPTEDIVDYLICDQIDSSVEVLTCWPPKLVEKTD